MLLNELILEGKINIKKTHQKVTYHDPCHLGRHCNIYEEPRQIIKNTSILVEMDRNRERSRCCGAGVKSAFPDIALKIASKRIEDAKSIDAEIIITSCSFCILNLKNAFKYGLGNDIVCSVSNILDIIELVVMGLEYEGF
ncbi:MAG: heterodisulfide reductase-related iron-sulfur binding cluster [Methanobacterium sp.]|nr:heterodisulfide reductase-related iron-sulfur binding cluster [Methanobacterium sp.]